MASVAVPVAARERSNLRANQWAMATLEECALYLPRRNSDDET